MKKWQVTFYAGRYALAEELCRVAVEAEDEIDALQKARSMAGYTFNHRVYAEAAWVG